MTNSLAIFFVSLVFLVFGYVSIVRIAYKHYFKGINGTQNDALALLAHVIRNLGHGALFTCLSATSLLLFWGWGIALLWLIAFHLLAETLFNFQLSTRHLNRGKKSGLGMSTLISQGTLFPESPASGSADKPASKPAGEPAYVKKIIEAAWQLYLLLIITAVVSLLVNLINLQSGLIFALIGLLPAHLLLRNTNTGVLTPLGIGISLAAILLSFLFSHQLGITIYGVFNPIESLGYAELAERFFPWLIINNTSIITTALIISGLVLSERSSFRADLDNLCGVLIIIALVILLAKLVWLQPLLDAPLNSLQQNDSGLPAFNSLGLFLFSGLSLLLLRQNNSTQQKTLYKKITDGLDGNEDPAPNTFISLQLTSLSILIFSILIFLVLASAQGIGAWSTHYLNWNDAGDLITHFNLAQKSLLDLINTNANASSLTYSLFLTGLTYTGFTLLLNVMAKLGKSIDPEADQRTSKISELKQSKIIPALLIYVVSSFLIKNGLSIDLWLLIGMLAWLLVTNTVIENSLKYKGELRNLFAQNITSLVLIALGSSQLIWTATRWVNESKWFFAFAAGLLLLFALLIWKNRVIALIGSFKNTQSSELFS